MFNLFKVKELKNYKKEAAIIIDSNIKTIEKLRIELYCKQQCIYKLKEQLKEAKDLSDILCTITSSKNNLTGNSSINVISFGDITRLSVSDDIPQYVEDIFDKDKKVIKQESNLGITIDKDGNVKTGRTRFACDKNRNYKLKQI
jgi:hypothetical protein